MDQKIKQDISIGFNIRLLRNRAQLTQEQTIAKMQVAGCQITRSTYAKIECGLTNIRVTELMALKKIFHADYGDFFQDLPADEKYVSEG